MPQICGSCCNASPLLCGASRGGCSMCIFALLQGGMPGAEQLRDSKELQHLLQKQSAGGRLVTAICAAPAVILEAQGFLSGKTATSHPAFLDKLSTAR